MRREIYLTTPMHDYELGDMYSTICLRVYDIVSQLLSIDLTAIGRGLLISRRFRLLALLHQFALAMRNISTLISLSCVSLSTAVFDAVESPPALVHLAVGRVGSIRCRAACSRRSSLEAGKF